MTVSNDTNRLSFAGDGVTVALPLTGLVFFADSTLVVTLVVDATGVETLQVITTNYTVSGGQSGVGAPATGTVTMVVAPAVGETIVVERQEPFTQTTDLVLNGVLNSQAVEAQMDKIVMQVQRVKDLTLRAILAPITYLGAQLTLPVPVSGEFLRGKTDLSGFENADITTLGSIGVPVAIADGGTAGITAAAARTNLDVPANAEAMLLAGASSVTGDKTFTGEVNLDGPLSLGDASELTIATGVVTPTANYHSIDTESDAASDDLDTIDDANMQEGALLVIRANNTARDVVAKHTASGNHTIQLADGADFTLDDDDKRLVLQLQSTEWKEVARSSASMGLIGTLSAYTATTSGTTSNLTGLDGAKRLTIMGNGVSGDGTEELLFQIGPSGGVETSGYVGTVRSTSSDVTQLSAGIQINNVGAAADAWNFKIDGVLIDSATNTWAFAWLATNGDTANAIDQAQGMCIKPLASAVTQATLTFTGTPDDFDAGNWAIFSEV